MTATPRPLVPDTRERDRQVRRELWIMPQQPASFLLFVFRLQTLAAEDAAVKLGAILHVYFVSRRAPAFTRAASSSAQRSAVRCSLGP